MGPATIRPRGVAAIRPAIRAMSISANRRRPTVASANGAIETAPARSGHAPRSPDGMSGSRNGALMCTGPAGPVIATATARPATERTCARVSGAASGRGSSVAHLTWRPYSPTWSMVWGAPRSRNSTGRSAVRTMSGTRAIEASTTAGAKFTTAVPDVPSSTTARPAVRAMPSAKNPAERSSSRTRTVRPSWAASARANGVEREPGHTTASRMPARNSSSVKARRVRDTTSALTAHLPVDPARRPPPAASSATPPTRGPGRNRPRCRSRRTASPGCDPRPRCAARP